MNPVLLLFQFACLHTYGLDSGIQNLHFMSVTFFASNASNMK